MSEEVLSENEVDALMESSGDDEVFFADDSAREYRRFDITAREQGTVNRMGALAAILERHEEVKEACVVGMDDSRLGQVPVAAVQLTGGPKTLSEESLRAWAKENMTSYFVPVRIAVVEDLPRTPSMKVSQEEVRRLFRA